MKQDLLKKFVVFILIFSFLIPMTAGNSANAVAENTISKVDEISTEASADDNVALVKTKKVSVTELTKGSQILKPINKEVLIKNDHVARLVNEESLSSYTFLNHDGSKTVYYMDKNVKFLDKDGNVVEKDISLKSAAGGFTTVSNDVGLMLPNNPADGIHMSYGAYDITLVPEGGDLRKRTQNNGTSVIYPDYFGTGTSLMYTPSLDGLEEDIILSSYTDDATFAFRLFTDGLRLYQENGHYYLAASQAAEIRIDMGDVIASDAKGRFSVGTIDVNTITQGQEYLLTLSVDKAFLTDKTTAYPVTVSPTLTVSDSF